MEMLNNAARIVPFREHGDPAFAPGARWTAADGSGAAAVIQRIQPWVDPCSRFDYDVHYVDGRGIVHDKGLWDFQVRYEPLTGKED